MFICLGAPDERAIRIDELVRDEVEILSLEDELLGNEAQDRVIIHKEPAVMGGTGENPTPTPAPIIENLGPEIVLPTGQTEPVLTSEAKELSGRDFEETNGALFPPTRLPAASEGEVLSFEGRLEIPGNVETCEGGELGRGLFKVDLHQPLLVPLVEVGEVAEGGEVWELDDGVHFLEGLFHKIHHGGEWHHAVVPSVPSNPIKLFSLR